MKSYFIYSENFCMLLRLNYEENRERFVCMYGLIPRKNSPSLFNLSTSKFPLHNPTQISL